MRRRCGNFCQKNGRARRAARRRRASAGRHGPVGTSGLQHRRSGSEDRSLSLLPTARSGASRPAAGACERAAAARLSAAVHPPEAGGRAVGRQPHPSAVPRRGSVCAQAQSPSQGRGRTGADPGGGEAECALVHGLRPRPVRQRAALAYPQHCR